jgi:ribose transport system permease protein
MTREKPPSFVWLSAVVKPETATALTVLLAAVVLMLTVKLVNPSFGSLPQVEAILITSIFLVVASYGQGLVILLGGIDLSLGVVIGIGGMQIAEITNGSNQALIWAVPMTLITCLGIGLVNGVGVAMMNIPPFIMTLAVGTTFFGVALGFTAGSLQKTVAPAVQALMSGRLNGIPTPLVPKEA